MTQSVVTKKVPKIQAPVETANSNAIHYGYTPFHSISCIGPYGIELDVQPGHSPFRTRLPEKELIPFITFGAKELDPSKAAAIADTATGLPSPPVTERQKSAWECAWEVAFSYQKLGFRVLDPLTGMDEDQASHIFMTIQPFEYSLKDMDYELREGAMERISATEPFIPFYGDLEWDEPLKPLPAELKPIAEKVRGIMATAADQSRRMAENIITDSTQKVEQYFASGFGKRTADPRDHKFFAEMAAEVPSVFNKTPNRTTPANEAGYLKTIADAIAGRGGTGDEDKDSQIKEMQERINQLTAAVEQLIPTPAQPAPSADQCTASTNAGTQCKRDAIENGLCSVHKNQENK